MATNKKPINGGAKTPSSKPVAKPTAPTPPPTPVSSPTPSAPPTTSETTNPSVSNGIAYGSKAPSTFQFKKGWKIIGVIVGIISVVLGAFSLGKKMGSPEERPASVSGGQAMSVETANPNKDFFEGPLVLKANDWSKTVFIRENIVWYPPLGVPYTIRINGNQEIPCDGIENPSLPDGVVSIQFMYRINTSINIKQVPFKKKT